MNNLKKTICEYSTWFNRTISVAFLPEQIIGIPPLDSCIDQCSDLLCLRLMLLGFVLGLEAASIWDDEQQGRRRWLESQEQRMFGHD